MALVTKPKKMVDERENLLAVVTDVHRTAMRLRWLGNIVLFCVYICIPTFIIPCFNSLQLSLQIELKYIYFRASPYRTLFTFSIFELRSDKSRWSGNLYKQ